MNDNNNRMQIDGQDSSVSSNNNNNNNNKFEESNIFNNNDKIMSIEECEKEARDELSEFLISKGIDPRQGDVFKIIIKMRDIRNKDNKKTYSVTYTAPDGSMCQTKRDVSEAILYLPSSLPHMNAKFESYRTSMKEVNAIINQGLPKRIENFKILNFGIIDKRPAFHNKFQIYPIGYMCEISLTSLDSNSVIYGDKYVLQCEIKPRLDDQPDFIITNITTGAIYWSVGNEREAWKKFDPNNLYGENTLSFFNLKIELLIEGLEGAVELESYQYHVERGYGETYTTQEQSIALKTSTNARERNRVQRLQTAGLTRDELKLKEEQLKEQQALDKEFTKTIAKADQERKVKEREEMKKIKEQEIQYAKEKKEEEKRMKELEKIEQKRNRKSFDPSDKNQDSNLNNEISSADYLQIIREESFHMVIDRFDVEQDMKEELDYCSTIESKESLEDILQRVKSCSEYFGLSELEKETGVNIDWDALIHIASTLKVYSNHLQHQLDSSLTAIINYLVSMAPVDEQKILKNFFSFLERSDKCIIDINQVTDSNMIEGSEITEVPDSLEKQEEVNTNELYNPKPFPSIYENLEKEEKEETNQMYRNDHYHKLPERFHPEKPPIKKKFGGVQLKFELDPFKYSIGAMERFQLCLMEMINKDCAMFFDLDEREPDALGKPIKKQNTLPNLRFPLNQLTFQEIARMSIQAYLLQELGRSTDDIQCAIRGSRQIPNRSAKSVIRQIRYRFAARAKITLNLDFVCIPELQQRSRYVNDHQILLSDIAGFGFDNYSPSTNESTNAQLRQELDNAEVSSVNTIPNFFDTEQELYQKLNEILKNNSYPEIYHRCCKVMQKLTGMLIGKSFFWEVDRTIHPDYYTIIRKPIQFCNVIANLSNKMYGEMEYESLSEIEFEALVSLQFRNDLMQVFNNCFVYNSEISFLFTHAQKLQTVAHRHIDRWMISEKRPVLAECDEKHCLLSHNLILNGNNSRCSRCLGEFDQEYLKERLNFSSNDDSWLFPASASLKSEDDWICPFCIREDSTSMKIRPLTGNLFYIDEWGPSSFIPWILNSEFNMLLSSFTDSNSFIRTLWKACLILSDPNKSNFSASPSDKRLQWNTTERVSVMEALCLAMRQNISAQDYITLLYDESNKLTKVRKSNAPYRKAENIESLKILMGDMGAKLFDVLSANDEDISKDDNEICQICLKTTLCTDETESDILIICDGCSKEFHLRCAGFEDVPEGDWYCQPCNEPIKSESPKPIDYKIKIDDYRNWQAEASLITEASQKRMQKLIQKDAQKQVHAEIVCHYCGYGELDVCSPLVVGQNIFEQHVFMKENSDCRADEFFENKNATSVNIQVAGENIVSKSKIPYFPYLDSSKGTDLIQGIFDLNAQPVIVHELCALQMFEARLTANKHSLRRKRNNITKKLMAMAGVPIRPLGVDSCGREYFKFPNSLHLFICLNEKEDNDREEFYNMLDLPISSWNGSKCRDWKVVVNPNEIKDIVCALGNMPGERKLRQNLINLVLSDFKPNHFKFDFPTDNSDASYKAIEYLVAHHSTDACHHISENTIAPAKFDKIDRASVNDNIPFAIKLQTAKGIPPIKRYCILEEAAYTDLNPGTTQEELNRLHEHFFIFKGGSGTRWFCIAIVNKAERKLILPKDSGYGVQYCIFRDDYSYPLMSTVQLEPYGDGYFYFAVPTWKRSGKYKIAFYLTGPAGAQIPNSPPLIYRTTVISKDIKCGPANAFDQLIARSYINSVDRHALKGRNSFNNEEKDRQYLCEEGSSVKHALMTVYMALPYGALGDVSEEHDEEEYKFNLLAEGNSWSEFLDEIWRGNVKKANDPVTLMECALLLEYYIQKAWIPITHIRLLNALPTPIYALRSATYSAVALRVFVLDKCLDYEKILKIERKGKGVGKVLYEPTYSASKTYTPEDGKDLTRSGRRSIKAGSQSDLSTSSVDFGRSKRGLEEASIEVDDKQITKKKKEEYIVKKIFSDDTSNHHNELLAAFPFDELIQSLKNRSKAENENSDKVEIMEVENANIDVNNSAEDYLNSLCTAASLISPDKEKVLTDNVEITEVVDAIIVDHETLIKVQSENKMTLEKTDDNNDIDDINDIDAVTIKFYTILGELQKDKESTVFWEPVDTKIYTDYRRFVKDPMDLGTVAERAINGHYKSNHEAFVTDMKKVWYACRKYNDINSDLVVLASKFETLSEQLYETHFKVVDPTSNVEF